jgi:hypothetical protein
VKEVGISALSPEICADLFYSTNLSLLPDRRQRYSDKYMKHIFFSILTALAFCHCQDAPTPPKNILTCYVRFDAAGRKVKAEASLHDGATKQAIELPGGLRFQSTAMKIIPVRGITYTAEYAAAYTLDQVFDWKNKSGEQVTYKLELPQIDSFFFDTKVLSIKKAANLRWIGKALDKNETLVFIWENKAKGTTVPMEVSTTLGEPLIEIPAAKLAQLGAGDWTLYLVRKRLERSELSDFKIESTGEYYTKPIQIKVES